MTAESVIAGGRLRHRRCATGSPPLLGGAPVLPTGAGHDAGVLSAHVPTAMLFVRNPTGVSHSPAEHADRRRLRGRGRRARRPCWRTWRADDARPTGAEHAWLGGPASAPDVLIEVDGRPVHRRHARRRRAAAGRRPGCAGLTLPGLANAHSHAFHRALRGRTHGGRGTFWTWREQMYAVAGRLDPDTLPTRWPGPSYAEMALAGITCVGEFHYLHHGAGGTPYADPNAMGAGADRGRRRGRHPDHPAGHAAT